MAIKKYKPTTPGRRGMTVTDYSVLSKVDPERSLLESKKKHAGRNNTGKITVRHHGGGNRVKYRVIDFKRNKFDVPATVKTLEYDPNRSAFIALVEYEDGAKSYILAPDGLKVGDTIMAGPNADIKPGNALPFENIPVGTMIHNIELYPGKGGQLVRSAGVMAQLMAKENGYALVRLPSGEMRNVRLNCIATIGVVSNLDHENVNLGKAGRKRRENGLDGSLSMYFLRSVIKYSLISVRSFKSSPVSYSVPFNAATIDSVGACDVPSAKGDIAVSITSTPDSIPFNRHIEASPDV